MDDYETLVKIAQTEFGPHPFATPMDRSRLAQVLPAHLALSQAFPYLQAAAHKDVIFDAIRRNVSVSEGIELTAAVSSFLYWDELGGQHVVDKHGKDGLPRILDTTQNFHANILRKDAEKILGHSIEPDYDEPTRSYLMALHGGLASSNMARRCAHMVAFELHASAFIESLWGTVAGFSGLPRDELEYFRIHMGGENPAEKAHCLMTQQLIGRLVPLSDMPSFLAEFRSAYQLSIDWCRDLVERPLDVSAEEEVWHQGACHCGAVKFEVRSSRSLDVVECNCSICKMSGFLHLIVPADRFHLLQGEDVLATYQFNRRVAKHTFCKLCGIKPFYRPRSNPSGYSINVHCLDLATVANVTVSNFDGQNWEASIYQLHGAWSNSNEVDIYAEDLIAMGSVIIPADTVFSGAEVEQIDVLQAALPEEKISIGDAGDKHDVYVSRILKDDPGNVPRRVNGPTSDSILEILDSAERTSFFSKLLGWNEHYWIRRAQVNRLVAGSFIGLHLDVASDPDFEFSVILQLRDDFDGGEFIVHPAGRPPQVFRLKRGEVLVTTCKTWHEVTKVSRNERTTLVYFLSRHSGTNRRNPATENTHYKSDEQ